MIVWYSPRGIITVIGDWLCSVPVQKKWRIVYIWYVIHKQVLKYSINFYPALAGYCYPNSTTFSSQCHRLGTALSVVKSIRLRFPIAHKLKEFRLLWESHVSNVYDWGNVRQGVFFEIQWYKLFGQEMLPSVRKSTVSIDTSPCKGTKIWFRSGLEIKHGRGVWTEALGYSIQLQRSAYIIARTRSTKTKEMYPSGWPARVYRMKLTTLTLRHNSPACWTTIGIPSVRIGSVNVDYSSITATNSCSSPSCPPFFSGKSKARIGFERKGTYRLATPRPCEARDAGRHWRRHCGAEVLRTLATSAVMSGKINGD